jgi:hypothetical protein
MRRIYMVYLAIKNGAVIHHTSLAAMKAADGVSKAAMQVEDAEFDAAGGLVRVINGAIVLGKTEAELEAETNAAREAEIEAGLQAIDAASGRAARAVALALASGKPPEKADTDKLDALEADAKALRAELITYNK